MELIPLPAFDDNYIWLLHEGSDALVVDPGDSRPVEAALERLDLKLRGILVTHHHADHTGGVDALREATGAAVHGPARDPIPQPYEAAAGGDVRKLLGVRWRVIDVPGHTRGHIAWFAEDMARAPLLFCGDTLFSGGCGRIFEGTAAQMLSSLDALAALPGDTQVCCAHEYTVSNLRFAQEVEPQNEALRSHARWCREQREHGLPTLPSTIARERAINPFLRTREPGVRDAVRRRTPGADSEAAVFAALREWKDHFR